MTTRTQDPLDMLAHARPTDARLGSAWTAQREESVLADIQAAAGGRPQSHPTAARVTRLVPGRRAWRRAAMTGVAAAAAGAAILVSSPTASREPIAQAHAIEQLALSAATSPQTSAGPGEYVHQVTRFVQQGRDAQTPAVDMTSESWVAADGTTWLREVSRRDPVATSYRRIPPAPLGDDPYFGVRPADYLSWPTGTGELRRYLESKVNRSALREDGALTQAVFEGLSDRFAVGTTPPQLNAAMIRVLGSLPGVRTTTATYAGQQAVRVAFTYDVEDALYFDERTAQFLGETMPGMQSRVLVRDVVASVPRDVRARAHDA